MITVVGLLWSCIPGFSDPAKMNLNTDHLKRCIETLRLSLIMSIDAVERWFAYRDNRNNTAHDYGENFAKETLSLIPSFIDDVSQLEAILRQRFNEGNN